jgi:hypothetical protein
MTPPTSPDTRRQRLVGLLLLGIALVLLVSSASWFGSSRVGIGIAQLAVGVVVAVAGGVLVRRSREGRPT